MADLLCVVEMPMTGANAGDKVVNTFAFHKEGAYEAGDASDIEAQVIQFYTVDQADSTLALSDYFSTQLDRGAGMCSIKSYDITGKLGLVEDPVTHKRKPVAHGSPIHATAWTLNATANNENLPSQIAVAMTLRARQAWTYPVEAPDAADIGFEPDRPRARRTGRLFLGPLNANAKNELVAPSGHVHANFRTDAMAHAEALQDSVNGFGYAWCVWSRQNEALSVIERVEIDNSFDVIRSRKSVATVRDVRTFAPVPALALGA